jgi:hypothetical protein
LKPLQTIEEIVGHVAHEAHATTAAASPAPGRGTKHEEPPTAHGGKKKERPAGTAREARPNKREPSMSGSNHSQVIDEPGTVRMGEQGSGVSREVVTRTGQARGDMAAPLATRVKMRKRKRGGGGGERARTQPSSGAVAGKLDEPHPLGSTGRSTNEGPLARNGYSAAGCPSVGSAKSTGACIVTLSRLPA